MGAIKQAGSRSRHMKFAQVNRERSEARPGLVGECPCCGSELIAKCGDVYAYHWAHKNRRKCDQWWENETEWHRGWKDRFPVTWQEVVHRAEDGEKHMSDIQTEDGWLIEFQHSPIKSEERDSREAFYKNLIWVIDGTARPTYEGQFLKNLEQCEVPSVDGRSLGIGRLREIRGRLLNQWSSRKVHVVIDFGSKSPLWWLIPQQAISGCWIMQLGREDFIQALGPLEQRMDQDFGGFADGRIALIRDFEIWEAQVNRARAKTLDPMATHRYRRRRF